MYLDIFNKSNLAAVFDPAAVFVPVAYFFDTLYRLKGVEEVSHCTGTNTADGSRSMK